MRYPIHADLDAHQLYHFYQGTSIASYQFMGAHPTKTGYRFIVWAPRVRAVSVIGSFNGWNETANPMKQAAEDFKDYDYIMVDTAGHSLHNDELKQDVESYIRVLEDIIECENFLVLSATTKYRDLIEIADAYSEMVAYRLIFTKMDETGATGNLYNIRLRTGAPMSYITNGQDVPDDIEVFNPQKIVRALLGGSS